MRHGSFLVVMGALLSAATAVAWGLQDDRFRQLEELLPTPSDQRAASGAPGHRYWQQRADYVIDVELDDKTQTIRGTEVITYTNNSPDALRYLWLQVDPNIFAKDSIARVGSTAPDFHPMPYKALKRAVALETFDGAAEIEAVRDARKRPLAHTMVGTMMRIELDAPLLPGRKLSFSVAWNYKINDAKAIRARTGYEHFKKNDNYIYEIAQWYPRMAAYTDVNGWHHKQYVGRGEFTIEFGDYLVRITVPDDHIVAATGELQNAAKVLSAAQRRRLTAAKRSTQKPVFVVTPEEAAANEKTKGKGKKTWVFRAKDVRDFAFASSRKFIWDAMGHTAGRNQVLAMSFYPNEAEPLWSKYSTQAVVHTMEVYSRYTFEYPYPVAISVNGPVGGMEYPMICFNGPRPEDDKTYYGESLGADTWWNSKYGLIGVVIHEVGHNYFPMVVNSDERQWTWMDEGLNTFVQYLAEQEWEKDFPSWRGEPEQVTGYMTSHNQVPIMTNSESLLQFGNNAYAKPATALNILRETILGREVFDYAFAEYARRWKFKRPMPADFFRSMEDASGTDLDWFWRGWFYTTDHVDIAVDDVRLYQLDTKNPDIEKPRLKKEEDDKEKSVSQLRNEPLKKRIERISELKDFYNEYEPHAVTEQDREDFKKFLEKLKDDEKALLDVKRNFYVVGFANRGGLVMPLPVELTFADGTKDEVLLPAEIWRSNPKYVRWMVMTQKELTQVVLDKRRQIADANERNNAWPPIVKPTRFQLFKEERKPSPMKQQKEWREKKAKEAADGGPK